MEYNNIDLIQNKAENLLSDLKTDRDASYLSTSQILLVVLFSVAIISLFILDGDSGVGKYLIFMVVLLSLLMWHRIKLNAKVKESLELTSYKSHLDTDKKSYTVGLLKYLSSGYSIKLTRLKSIRLFFCIIFPLFLVLSKEVYQYFTYDGFIETSFMQYVLAFVLGTSFWYYFFYSEIIELDLDKVDVDSMVSRLHL